MSLSNVSTPYDTFTDQYGKIISTGSVYIGVAGEDPEENPINVYWDSAGTIIAAQPLQIINGYICNSGTPAQVFTTQDYSIRTYSMNAVVYYYPNILATTISGTAGGALTGTYPNPGLAAASVTTAIIADNNVTNAKLVAGTNNSVKGTTSASTSVADLTAYQLNGVLGKVGEEVTFTHDNFDPTLYAYANGATLSRTDDARLFTAVESLLGTQGALGWGIGDGSTTFTLPDYRGRFGRAYSDISGIDPDAPSRILGSDQLDAFQGHEHTYTLPYIGSGANTQILSDAEASVQTGKPTTAIVTDGVNGTPRPEIETRPRNYTHYVCIVR